MLRRWRRLQRRPLSEGRGCRGVPLGGSLSEGRGCVGVVPCLAPSCAGRGVLTHDMSFPLLLLLCFFYSFINILIRTTSNPIYVVRGRRGMRCGPPDEACETRNGPATKNPRTRSAWKWKAAFAGNLADNQARRPAAGAAPLVAGG